MTTLCIYGAGGAVVLLGVLFVYYARVERAEMVELGLIMGED